MKTPEDEAFEELERRSQSSVRTVMDSQVAFRNAVIEEVAAAIEQFGAFGPDTIGSFAAYIRSMKC